TNSNYFADDVLNRLIEFLNITYGEEKLEENLTFITKVIGKRTNETAREAIRRYFIQHFYKDHVRTYEEHPIIWLFSSGKKKAFQCLIYMHRYDKTTLSRIRTEYVHEVLSRYEMRRNDLLALLENETSLSAKEKRDVQKELHDLEKKLEEIKAYEEKLHNMAKQQ